jgi:hypothetical protein
LGRFQDHYRLLTTIFDHHLHASAPAVFQLNLPGVDVGRPELVERPRADPATDDVRARHGSVQILRGRFPI